ncbi:MAG: carboxylesterase family protein, partial [Promethearchaeota archaeon]
RLGPIIDKISLPEHPLEAIRKCFAKDIDLFIGTNLDESKLWLLLTPQVNKLTEEELLQNVKRRVNLLKKDEITSKMLIDIYREGRKTPRNIMDAISTDYSFRIPAIQLAESQCEHRPNTYMYLFAWKNPMDGGKYGAMHALELPFVFGLLGNQDIGFFPHKSEETMKLSEKMMDSWIAFAHNGNPNHKNIPELPPYNKKKRSTIIFDKEVKVEEDPHGNERMAWDNIL